MAELTRREQVLVLRKTKLGESDLILTFLAHDGSQLRAVAKGARKPSNTFATRLELYARSDVLLAKGKSLDLVKEARLIDAHSSIHASMERAACAAPIAELLWRTSQEGLTVPRLFDCSAAAFSSLDARSAHTAPALCAAALLKILAFNGLRPSFSHCVVCGSEVWLARDERATTLFSVSEGGVVCPQCRTSAEASPFPAAALAYAATLLSSTFKEVATMPPDASRAFAALRVVQQICREHEGVSLKSLSFLFTSGLF